MSALLDLTGKRFGRWTVVSRAPDIISMGGHRSTAWLCKCQCGNQKVVRAQSLTRGSSCSCGCLHQELRHEITKTHGGTKTRLYHIWASMRQRCTNPNNHAFKDYGGRGIYVCADWQRFDTFRAWALANGYRDDLSIDRIDNNKGYEPENCRWASNSEQSNNQRSNVLITFRGVTKTRSQWAHDLGINPTVLRDRLDRYGWTVERALTEDLRRW